VEVGIGDDNQTNVKLSTLIKALNDRFGTDFLPAARLFFD
jgi:hypothetical protein